MPLAAFAPRSRGERERPSYSGHFTLTYLANT